MRAEKQFLLDDIKEKIDNSSAFIVTKYTDLNPNFSANFRKELSKVGGEVEVVKKTILVKAAESLGITIDIAALNGHIGVIFADKEAAAVTKALYNLTKDNEEQVQVLLGHFEGALCSPQDVEHISKLPDKNEMRAQFLGLLEAPMAQTLATMEALLTSVMHCIENKTQSSS